MKKRDSILAWFIFNFAFMVTVYSCKKSEIDIDPDAGAQRIESTVPASGGSVVLADVATVIFGPNSFQSDTKVTVTKSTADKAVINLYNEIAEFYGVDTQLGYFVKVSLDGNNPTKDVTVKIKLPESFYASRKNGYAFEAMGLLNQSVDEEELFSFDVLGSKLLSSSREIEVTVPAYYFDIKDNGKRYEAVFTVVTLPGNNKGGRIAADDCGFYVRCPLANCTLTSPFDPNRPHPTLKNKDGSPVIRPHRGVDLRAPSNTQVYAAYDGTVINATVMNGYGKVIDIVHVNSLGQRFATRYAHLNAFQVKKGDKITEGDPIALSGKTGGISSAPHLHFEYFVNGNVNDKNGNIDPMPMINTESIRLLSAQAKLTGINDCSSGSGSSWKVTFDYKDPSNRITPKAKLTFQDIEPVVNPPYTVPVGSLKTADGLVQSPVFCARFNSFNYFKVKVFITLENGTKSNCINFILNKEGAAKRTAAPEGSGTSNDRPGSSLQ